jgi:DNA-binding transcriptional ArsR family regulator
VVRVNFTADDLARTRFSAAPAPLVETGLALVEMRRAAVDRRRMHTRPWLREAWRAFPPTARPLLDLFGPRAPWPDFIDSPAPDLSEALGFVCGTPRRYLRSELTVVWRNRPDRPPAWLRDLADGDADAIEILVRALRDFHDAIVAPRWDSVLSSFHGDVARRMLILAAGGHQALFGALHHQLRWRDDGLERQGGGGEYELRGGGLLLMPSAFWSGPPVFAHGDGVRAGCVLLYEAQPNGHRPGPDHILAGVAGADNLAALLGPTRAAVLRALREPHSTVDLAGTVGISPASASEHAKVLREAYLVETRREGRSVRHSLTPLGSTILGQLRPGVRELDGRAG